MNLGRATQLAIQTMCRYLPEDSQECRLAIATFDAIRLAVDAGKVQDIRDLRAKLRVPTDMKPPKDELGDLF